MMVRIKAVGDGTPDSPIRAPLPTYGMVGYDPVSGFITVDIPDTDAPDGLPAKGSPSFPKTPYGHVLIGLAAAEVASWRGKLARRYPDSKSLPDVGF